MTTQQQGWCCAACLPRAFLRFVIYFLSIGSATCASAQNATPDEEYSRYLAKARVITPLSSFGDRVSPRDGALSFSQTDVELPGTGPTIRLVRTFQVAARIGRIAETSGNRMGEWELALPRLKTLASAKTSVISSTSPRGWQVGMASDARCTQMGSPGTIFPTKADPIEPETWWAGYQLVKDSGEEENVLAHRQDGSQPAHVARTKSHWIISCLASTANGLPGEAFQAISPDGTRYWLDYLVYKTAPGLGGAGTGFLPRHYASMLVTRVEDRFGNWVRYNYTEGLLNSIEASDGRRINIANDGTNISAITVVSASGNRTWRYNYNQTALASLILPDGTSWQFSLDALFYIGMPRQNYGNCANTVQQDGMTGVENTGTVTAPSGASAKFLVRTLHIGRSYVPKACWTPLGGSGSYAESPKDSWVYAISSKTISGPGIAQATWTYSYSPGNSSWSSDCASGCTSTVWTDVTDPDGVRNRSVFSNRADGTENLLLRSEVHAAGSGALVRVIDHTYAVTPLVESNSPYPWRSAGGDFTPRSNRYAADRWTPVLSSKITQEGSEFVSTVNSYDVYARPLSVTRASPWHSRTDVTAYHDNIAKWVLGQVARSTNSNTGLIENEVTYSANAQPLTIKAFGKLQQALTYNADGTVATVKDGNNNTTTFSSWKRGVPQSIKYADGKSQAAEVDDNGWVRSVTDENGYATTYTYDAMGRLASIAYPANDSTAWNTTTQSFQPVTAAEYGIAAGHWRRTEATGNARRITYFDALWRPLLVREYDTAKEAATQRFQRFAYDHEGRVIFASYPGSSDALNSGTWTEYDALGRITSVSTDSEQGLLTTLTEYLPGNQTRVTDPRGNKTVSGYQVFDNPEYEKPVWILHPEGARTDIARDVFGNVTQIVRGKQ
ncbi:MAG: hypothetical protein QM581_01610 [Pseudomonas sp.]